MAPAQWSLSYGITLSKNNHKSGGDSFRWIHLLDPFSKQWHAQLLAPVQATHCEHGYIPKRSRESAITVINIGTYRLANSGLSFQRDQFDLRNAFWSVDMDDLLSTVEQITEYPQDKVFFLGRFRNASFVIDTYSGVAVVILGQGVLAGDQSAVAGFRTVMKNISVGVQNKHLRTTPHARLLVLKAPDGTAADTSLCLYADDKARLSILCRQSPFKTKHEIAKPWFKENDVSGEKKRSAARRAKLTVESIPKCNNYMELVRLARCSTRHHSSMYPCIHRGSSFPRASASGPLGGRWTRTLSQKHTIRFVYGLPLTR